MNKIKNWATDTVEVRRFNSEPLFELEGNDWHPFWFSEYTTVAWNDCSPKRRKEIQDSFAVCFETGEVIKFDPKSKTRVSLKNGEEVGIKKVKAKKQVLLWSEDGKQIKAQKYSVVLFSDRIPIDEDSEAEIQCHHYPKRCNLPEEDHSKLKYLFVKTSKDHKETSREMQKAEADERRVQKTGDIIKELEEELRVCKERQHDARDLLRLSFGEQQKNESSTIERHFPPTPQEMQQKALELLAQ